MNYFEVNGKRYGIDEIKDMDEAELYRLLKDIRVEGYCEGYSDGYNNGYINAREDCW